VIDRRDAAALRIGCVKYLNARPLIHGWGEPVVFGHPSVLCDRLAAGELDIALVSSFEFLRQPIYTVVDHVAVAADGPVYSVFVAHDRPLEQIEEIAVDPASRTSVNLLRCLLAERGLRPCLITDNAALSNTAGARLLIGDRAIRFRQDRGGGCEIWDLAAAWKELTGLPFVFALWLIRPEVENPARIAQELRCLRDENLRALESVIEGEREFAREFCSFYFRECLRFSFGATEKAGLFHFRALCHKHEILPPADTPLRIA